ncbi:MAG TPA: lactate utilization protein [Anaeromyxobacteraceae bacterium]
MFDLFKAKAEAVSAEVHRVADRDAARELVMRVLDRERVEDAPGARAVWREGTLLGPLDQDVLATRAPGLSFEVTRERAADSRVGVTEFDWALADTGTLAQDATDPALRLASTLTETHVALVRADAILPDLASLLPRLDPARMRYLACVTGPSRTADIERVLTIGVHGPKRLVVVVVDGAREGR